jgi:hypothetical protein
MYSLAIKLINDAQVKAAMDAAQVTTEAITIHRERKLPWTSELSEKPIRVLKDDDGAAFLLVEAAVVKGLAWHLEQMADPNNELCETAEDEAAARQLAAELRAVA